MPRHGHKKATYNMHKNKWIDIQSYKKGLSTYPGGVVLREVFLVVNMKHQGMEKSNVKS